MYVGNLVWNVIFMVFLNIREINPNDVITIVRKSKKKKESSPTT